MLYKKKVSGAQNRKRKAETIKQAGTFKKFLKLSDGVSESTVQNPDVNISHFYQDILLNIIKIKMILE